MGTIPTAAPLSETMDVLFDGTVYLPPGATFNVTAYNSNSTYTVNMTTPLGALNAAATAANFTYDVTDKKMNDPLWVLLLDNIDGYLYQKTPKHAWYAYVNDVYKDGYNGHDDGLNVIQLVSGDTVEFYYVEGSVNATDLNAVIAAANATVKTVVSTMDVLFDGTVDLTPGATFNVTAYNSNSTYTVNMTTPLGALNAAATAANFTYDVTDKKMNDPLWVLLLDNIDGYLYQKTPKHAWYAYVNDVFKDGYNGHDDGLNVIQLVHDDTVEFYYVEGTVNATDLNAVKAAANATVKTVVSTMDVLFDGTVDLTPDATFNVTAYNSNSTYTVNMTTPLGALNAAAIAANFTYDVTDKKMNDPLWVLLLDNIDGYLYQKTPKHAWYAYVNDVFKDGYNGHDDGLNVIQLVSDDTVEFYYVEGTVNATDLNAVKAAANATVKTVVSTGGVPTDWTLELAGAKETSVTKADFEAGLACGHNVSWTDGDGNIWEGISLWRLVAMVDDDPDPSAPHYSFNDDLAAQHYEVNVIASDGYNTTLDSADIARDDGYIVANTLNGEELPLETESEKPCWPLYLKGPEVSGGQQVGGIVRIELSGLPQPPEGWTLEMVGDVGDVITQAEFEAGLACNRSGHYQEWTDKDGNVWSGVPLWVLLGTVDDIETGSHWTFNDDVAAAGYTINVIAGDNFTKSFNSTAVARSDNYIVANKINGEELPDPSWPLRLVGAGVTKPDGSLGGSAVGNIVKIEIPELETPPAAPGSWNLNLTGKITDVISQAEFEAALACPSSGHYQEWTDKDGNNWSGMPLWFLAGWVDDRQPHNFNANQAMAGYTVVVKAGDGYSKSFNSTAVAQSNDYIVANKINGENLSEPSWPLRLVGAGVANPDGSLGSKAVGNIVEIELTDFNAIAPETELHIIKYATDGTTVLNETTVDYLWMEENLAVIGNGTTVYKFEGVTFDPDDLWDPNETCPNGFKIQNAVKGTRIRDLCELVGGMGSGTEIKLIASDGYETTLPYSSIYTNPAVQARQGDAILAWWSDGEYVPSYADGMRLFFTPEDTVYGQWDMHETLSENYWHWYYDSGSGIQYPSCAGLSAKYVTTIKIYSVPITDWTLVLDGTAIGGLSYNVSRTYFEQALACQQGANHQSFYTDSHNDTWGGMALWLLAGFVDDQDMHSNNAFNDTLAEAGYWVVISNADGVSVTINSTNIIRNANYIVANTLNGENIPDTDEDWPLVLVGPGSASIAKITEIKLLPFPSSRCFIATAAYGTPTAEQINVLRDFRDEVLLQNSVGSKFVDLYYRLSPPVAHFIAGNEFLRTLVRELLVDPLVCIVKATGTIWRN
jgi:DMSO/TMAO reductase YedYZ molybdopterin-dependent catalytic subunit